MRPRPQVRAACARCPCVRVHVCACACVCVCVLLCACVCARGRGRGARKHASIHARAHTHTRRRTLCAPFVESRPLVARMQVPADHLHHVRRLEKENPTKPPQRSCERGGANASIRRKERGPDSAKEHETRVHRHAAHVHSLPAGSALCASQRTGARGTSTQTDRRACRLGQQVHMQRDAGWWTESTGGGRGRGFCVHSTVAHRRARSPRRT